MSTPSSTPMIETTITIGEGEVVTSRRFVCETHDEPGSCDEGCARLIAAMSGDDGVDFDPTGCSYGPPRAYCVYEFDKAVSAVFEVTLTPGELLD